MVTGWNPYPEPPPGVPEHLVGTIHAPGIYSFAVAADRLETLGPVVLELDTADAGPSYGVDMSKLNAALADVFHERLVQQLNNDLWGIRMLSTHRYNGPWDDGDEDRGLAHDRAEPMSHLLEAAIRDVPRTARWGGRGYQQLAAERLRRADAHETEAALARALERED